MSDGRIEIDTKINESGLDRGLNSIDSKLKGIGKTAVQQNKKMGSSFKSAIGEYKSGFSEMNQRLSGFNSKVANMSTSITKGVSGFTAGFNSILGTGLKVAGGLIAGFGAFAVKSASDIRVMEAQYSQAFKGIENEAGNMINNLSKEFNILPNRLKEQSAQFQGYFKGTGLEAKSALMMTDKAMRIASDSAAYFDISLEEASQKLKSFVMGNYMVGDSIGINANKTKIATWVNEKFGESFDDLSESAQAERILQYAENVQNLSGITGQAERESRDWAVVLGNLTSTIKDLAGAVAEPFMDLLIGAMETITNIGQGVITKLQGIGEEMSKFETFGEKIGFLKEQFSGLLPLASGLAVAIAGVNLAPMLANGSELINVLGLTGEKLAESPSKFRGFAEGVRGAFGSLKGVPKNFLTGFTDMFPTLATDIHMGTTMVKSALSQGVEPWASVMSDGVSKLTGTFPRISSAFAMLPNLIGQGMAGIGSAMKLGLTMLSPALIVGAIILLMGVIQSTFGDQIEQIKANLLENGVQMIQGFVQGITSQIGTLMSAGAELFASFAEVFVALAPTLFDAGLTIIESILQGLMSNMGSILSSAIQIVGQLAVGIATAIPRLIVMGMQLILSLITGIVSNLGQIISYGVQAVTSFISGMADAYPTVLATAGQIIIQIIVGIVKAIPMIIEAGITIVKALIEGLLSMAGNLFEAGVNLIKKGWEGIKSFFGFGDAGKEKGQEAKDGLEEGANMAEVGTKKAKEGKEAVEGVDYTSAGQQKGEELKAGEVAGASGVGDELLAKVQGTKEEISGVDLTPEGTHLGQSLTDGASGSVANLPSEVQGQVDTLGGNLGAVDFSSQGQQVGTSFVQGFQTGLQAIQENINTVVTSVTESFGAVDLTASGTTVAQTFATGFQTGLMELSTTITNVVMELNTIFTSIDLTPQGLQVAQSFVMGMQMGLLTMATIGALISMALMVATVSASGTAITGGMLLGQLISQGLATGIIAGGGAVAGAISIVTAGVMVSMMAMSNRVSTLGTSMMARLASSVTSGASRSTSAFTSMGARVGSIMVSMSSRVASLSVQMMARFNTAIMSGGQRAVGTMSSIGSQMVGRLQSFSGAFFSVGVNLMQGVANGIRAGGSSVISAAVSVMVSALKSAKASAGVKSPAKEWNKHLGRWLPEGVAQGIDQNKASVLASTKDMMVDTLNKAKNIKVPNLNDFKAVPSFAGAGSSGNKTITNDNTATLVIENFNNYDTNFSIKEIDKRLTTLLNRRNRGL